MQNQEELRELASSALVQLKNPKSDPETETLIELAMANMPSKSHFKSVFLLFKSHLFFRNHKFNEFRETWILLSETDLESVEMPTVLEMFRSYCLIWEKHLKTINLTAELEKQLERDGFSDNQLVFELAELLENVNTPRSVELLFKIVAKDKNWNNFLATKKCVLVIDKLKSSEAKSFWRRKLNQLIRDS